MTPFLPHDDRLYLPNVTSFTASVPSFPVAGSRVLDCKGCVSGQSHWDVAIIQGRTAAGLPSGRRMFVDTADEVVAKK